MLNDGARIDTTKSAQKHTKLLENVEHVGKFPRRAPAMCEMLIGGNGGPVLDYFTGIPYFGLGVAVVSSHVALGYGRFAGMLNAGVSARVNLELKNFNNKNNCSSCGASK